VQNGTKQRERYVYTSVGTEVSLVKDRRCTVRNCDSKVAAIHSSEWVQLSVFGWLNTGDKECGVCGKVYKWLPWIG
jgi:hypothetical protein